MTRAFTAGALAIGYALWRVAPTVQDWLGLGWAADFGQLCLVIVAISVLGGLAERFLNRRAGAGTAPPPVT